MSGGADARHAFTALGMVLLALLVLPGQLSAQGPPNAPVDLEVRSHNDHFHLTWEEDNSGNRRDAFFFRIYRDGTPIGTSGNEDHRDDDVVFGVTYTYEVSAVDILGREGDLSDAVTATLVDESPPDEPEDLEAVAVSSSRIDLSWEPSEDDDSGVGGYYVYRDGGETPHDSTTGPAYSDAGLQGFTEYSYRVSAFNPSHVESDRSDAASARTLDGSPPGAPGNLEATAVSGSDIELTWSAASDPESGIRHYYVYRDGGSSPIDSTSATNYTDTGLSGGGERSYEVAAVNGVGLVGPRSNSASATPLDGSPPSIPAGLTAEATGASVVELSWAAANDPESGISTYLVYRDGTASPIDSTTMTTYADATVEAETSYSYRVSARNGAGLEGGTSTAVEVTTPAASDATAPTAPGNFTVTAPGPTRVELSWTAADDPETGISGYRIYRDDVQIGSSPGGGFVDLTVAADSTYAYEVSAVNGDGLEGPRTVSVEVTTPGPGNRDTVPPAPPTNLRVVTG